MPHNRFFLNVPFQLDENVTLTGEEAHHLKRVMRKKEGESIELVNGNNQLAQASIVSVEKREVLLQIETLKNASPPSFPILLCQAIPRLNRLDTIVEKGTELGMTELWLFPGELSEKKELSATQLKRLDMIAISAMKQCGRLDLPKITLKPPLLKWSKEDFLFPAYFGDLSQKAPKFLTEFQKEQGIQFFIGPESGFTSDEESHLKHYLVKGVNLHPHILRTDTASLVAISSIMEKLLL